MAVSLEAREPFLDHRVFEFSWSMPLSMKIRDDRGKWILRALLRRHLPAQLVDREKQGFGLPLAEWLRGPLRPWAESLINDVDDSLFDAPNVRGLWQRHLGGEDQQSAIWTVLMYQGWARL
jgi:asparagine synthase (glutamine-hydrolysing)